MFTTISSKLKMFNDTTENGKIHYSGAHCRMLEKFSFLSFNPSTILITCLTFFFFAIANINNMRIFNNNNIWIFSKYTNTHTHIEFRIQTFIRCLCCCDLIFVILAVFLFIDQRSSSSITRSRKKFNNFHWTLIFD